MVNKSYTLTYFPVMGRSEPIRFLFAYAGVPFTDNRVPQADWPALKPKMPMGQVPVLEVDGKQLCQTVTISRFLANEFGLAGENSFDRALTDMYVDGVQDVKVKYIAPMLGSILRNEGEPKRIELYNTLKTEGLIPLMDRYEKFLAKNGTGHFVGKKNDLGGYCDRRNIGSNRNSVGSGDFQRLSSFGKAEKHCLPARGY